MVSSDALLIRGLDLRGGKRGGEGGEQKKGDGEQQLYKKVLGILQCEKGGGKGIKMEFSGGNDWVVSNARGKTKRVRSDERTVLRLLEGKETLRGAGLDRPGRSR